MKRSFPSITLGVISFALILSACLVASAQNREKFVISAKAGGINSISGRPERRAYPGADWTLLNVTDDLKAGDQVKTGADGRVEMLLNPGSYLRVGENSEFQLVNSSLENLEVRLHRGTAIIEATGADETELAINITTPHARMVIVKRGLYRVNVIPGDTTELFVRKGRVMLADTHTKVKEGNKVVFSGTTFSVAKMEKADKSGDLLESWSKDRAHTVALANNRVHTRDINMVVAGLQDYWWGSFFAKNSGVWMYNSYFGCFTFMPFGYGWGSPYGSSYSRIFGCGSCAFSPNYDRLRIYETRGWGSYGTGSAPMSGSSPASSGPSVGGSAAGGPRGGGAPASEGWPGRRAGKTDTITDDGRQRTIPPR
jgi:hypothetical protein